MRPRHAQGLSQRRRQEFVAARFPCLAAAVGAEPATGAVADQLGKRAIERIGPFERQDQSEGGVEVRADADRIGQHAQIFARRVANARASGSRSAAHAVRVAGRLEMQIEQPGPTIGPLEPPAQRPVEIGQLGANFLAP